MTTTNANNNYMSGSSVYDIDITAVLNEASTNASSVIPLLNNQINNLNKEISFLKTNALAQEIKINELIKNISMIVMASPEPQCIRHHYTAPFPAWNGAGNETWQKDCPENNPSNMTSIYSENIKLYHDFQTTTIQLHITQLREKRKAEAVEKIRLEVEDKEKAKAKIIAENKDKAIKDMLARVIIVEEAVKREELSLEDLNRNSAPLIDLIDKSDQIYQELLTREANGIAKAAEIRAEIEKFRGTRNGR
jgi:hypothetical protein